MRHLLLLAAVMAAGCRATMIETHGGQTQLFKTGLEAPGHGGAIKYLSNGPAAITRARRSDAEKQMRGFCGGDYAITREGKRSQFSAKEMPVGDKGVVDVGQWTYIAFECAK